MQNVLRTLPHDAADRKAAPIITGCVDYFPLALAEVAKISKAGNDQHNPGQPLHWARGKSADHADCVGRHLVERGTLDKDGHRHTAKAAWRVLALLQEEMEAAAGWTPDPNPAATEPVILKITQPGEITEWPDVPNASWKRLDCPSLADHVYETTGARDLDGNLIVRNLTQDWNVYRSIEMKAAAGDAGGCCGPISRWRRVGAA